MTPWQDPRPRRAETGHQNNKNELITYVKKHRAVEALPEIALRFDFLDQRFSNFKICGLGPEILGAEIHTY